MAIGTSTAKVTARAVSHPLLDFCNVLFNRIPDTSSGWKSFFGDWLPTNVRGVAFCLFAVAVKEETGVTRLDVEQLSAGPRVTWLVEFRRSAILVLVDDLLSVCIRCDAKITGK